MKFGILFDLDGTLLDSLGDIQNSMNYTLAQYGLPLRTLPEIRQFVGNGARHLVQCSLPGREDDPPVDQALQVYQAHYAAHCQEKTAPYAGVLEALAQIQGKYPVAIVSNKPDGAVKALARQYFPGVYALGETADCPRKPAADMLYKAMQHLGVQRCVYVGDSEVDVQTAKNADAPCVSVLWGFRDEAQIRQAGGTHFCHDPKDLPKIIDQLIKE